VIFFKVSDFLVAFVNAKYAILVSPEDLEELPRTLCRVFYCKGLAEKIIVHLAECEIAETGLYRLKDKLQKSYIW